MRQSTPFTPETAEEMLRTKFWSGLRDPALKNALRNKMDAGLAFDNLIVAARVCELEVKSTEQTSSSQPKLKQLHVSAGGHMEQKIDSLIQELTKVRERIARLESQPVGQPATTLASCSRAPRLSGNCYKCRERGHKKAQCTKRNNRMKRAYDLSSSSMPTAKSHLKVYYNSRVRRSVIRPGDRVSCQEYRP